MSSSDEVPLFNTEDAGVVQSTPSEALQLVCNTQDSRPEMNGGGRARKPAGRARGSNPKPSRKKRGGGGIEGYDHHQYNTTKKPRLIWTPELHQKFLQAHEIYIESNCF